MYELVERETFDDAVRDCAEVIATRLALALTRDESVTLMASGGNVPLHVLPRLGAANLPWDRITVLASDERIVPPDHTDSNEGAIRGALIGATRALRYYGLPHFTADARLSASYDEGLASLSWPPAVGLIGIGTDAHTASLFPERPEVLDETSTVLLVPETAPHRHARVTLGVLALEQTPLLVLIANGAEKRAALNRALAPHADPLTTPITRLLLSRKTMIQVFVC